MRLCDRALNNISRLEPSSKPSQDPSAPFNAPPNDHVTPIQDFASPARNPYKIASGGAHATLSWQLADVSIDRFSSDFYSVLTVLTILWSQQQLAQSILRVSTLHLARGSPKDALFYATQAIDLAQNLGSERLAARALSLRAEVYILLNKWDEAGNDLEQVETLLGTVSLSGNPSLITSAKR
jgi:hypothetical protein